MKHGIGHGNTTGIEEMLQTLTAELRLSRLQGEAFSEIARLQSRGIASLAERVSLLERQTSGGGTAAALGV